MPTPPPKGTISGGVFSCTGGGQLRDAQLQGREPYYPSSTATHPLTTLPPSLRIANAAAVLDGPYGAVTRQAARSGISRQALYRDTPRIVPAVDGSLYRQQLHRLCQDNDRLRAQCDHLQHQLQHAIVLDADPLARFASTAQAEGVSSGRAKGVALVNQQRPQRGEDALADQEDHFPTLREGRRALRQVQQRVCRAIDAAAAAQRREQHKARRTGSRQGTAAATARVQRVALAAVEAGAAVETAWGTIVDAVQLFTPTGELNTRRRAEGIIAAALPLLDDLVGAKTRRAWTRPQLLTYLERTQERLAALPVSPEVREAAVQAEGLRQRPAKLLGSASSSAALRGVLLATGLVRSLSGSAALAALTQVGQVLRQAWRASRLVECLNSVAWMQQSRHRRMTPGLLALKRLSWNGRSFSPGRRRQQTP